MNICLVQAPCWGMHCYPYAISLLKGMLTAQGHAVDNFDLNAAFYSIATEDERHRWNMAEYLYWLNPENVRNLIDKYRATYNSFLADILSRRPQLVGFTIFYTSEQFSLTVARDLKEVDPAIRVVFGGPHAHTMFNGRVIAQQDVVDFVVRGEGEVTMLELVSRMENGENDFVSCPGLIFQDAKNEVIVTEPREPIGHLDTLPYADFGDFDSSLYIRPNRIPLALNRGCPNRCIFCNERALWEKFRAFSGKRIFQELLEHMARSRQVDEIEFHHSLINGDIRGLEEFCDLVIEHNLLITWTSQATFRKEMTLALLEKMYRAGCRHLDYGMETASQRMLRHIGKNLSVNADLYQILRDTRAAGINSSVNVMFGFPDETEEDFQETLTFLLRIKDYVNVISPSPGFCSFSAGSLGYENPERYGIDLTANTQYWTSQDGRNTYLLRMERFERFLEFADKHDFNCLYPYKKLHMRNFHIANYYQAVEDYEKSLSHFIKSYEGEERSSNVLNHILDLSKELGKLDTYKHYETYAKDELS